MSKFSSGDAAIYGFTLFKRAPGTVTGVLLLLFITIAFQTTISFLPVFTGWPSTGETGNPNISYEILTKWSWFFLLLSFLLSYTAWFMIWAAILRPLTRDQCSQSRGFLGLKIGMDELRLFVLALLLMALFVMVYLFLFTVGVILGLFVGLMGHALDGPSNLTVAFIFTIPFISLFAFLYLAIRLSPAFAATIGEQRFVIFEAFNMTRGRFWGIFGAYALAYLMVIGIFLVLWVGALAMTILVSAPLEEMTPGTILRKFDLALLPVFLGPVAGFVIGAIYLFGMLPIMGVGAYVYRHWAQQRDDEHPNNQAAAMV
ncbi:MAG: hypothetical protein H2040_02720 [Euryhalocaulis sp.]|uniref:hypothetical protein n=1 Tax=Euryhalocaulis sp. TaxID=2744307 RepID=UPI0017CD2093|nr:hypothetical protein [Euryhalocaulis sp.]MBA4800753.1 hypothetical protein [Euryhalocaulis sp.]